MSKRKNGEGTWGTKIIKGTEYKYYRDTNGKYFYGKSDKEINEKRKKYMESSATKITSKSTLMECAEEWLLFKKISLESTTYDNYETYIRNILNKSVISKYQISSITKKMITDFLEDMCSKYAKATIEKQLIILKSIFKYAIDNNLLKENPMINMKLPKDSFIVKKEKEVPFITKEDLDKLYIESKRINVKGFNFGGKLGEPVYGNNAYAIILIGHTGLRTSELKGLRWKDVDLINKTISVNSAMVRVKSRDESSKTNYTYKTKQPKSKAGIRTIPLSDIAIEMIEYFDKQFPNHTNEDLVVLTKNGTSPTQRNLYRTLNIMLVRANCSVTKCGLHGLRHSFGSILIANKVDIKIVSKLLGHADITTTYNIYINFTKEQVENAVVDVFNKDETQLNKIDTIKEKEGVILPL